MGDGIWIVGQAELLGDAFPNRVWERVNSESDREPVCRVGESGVLVHNTSQGPNPITKADGEMEVADIQRQFNIDPDENVAYAEVVVGSFHDDLIGISGSHSPAGTVPAPSSRLFDTFDIPPGFCRGNDAEVKLLEEIAKAIEPNAQKGQSYANHTGSIRLYSHFTICASCDGVIAAFKAMFPNIEFSYSDGD